MSDLNEALPPQWIKISEASKWIREIFNIPTGNLFRKLCSTVRDSNIIRHRIGKSLGWSFEGSVPRGATTASLPRAASNDAIILFPRKILVAEDWDILEADFGAGTAIGLDDKRVEIEVLWSDVECWVEPLVAQERKAQMLEQNAAAGGSSVKEVSKDSTAPDGLQCTTYQEETALLLLNKKRGKKPFKLQEIIAKMVAEYQGEPERLKDEKIITLQVKYGSSNGTIFKAQKHAYATLNQTYSK